MLAPSAVEQATVTFNMQEEKQKKMALLNWVSSYAWTNRSGDSQHISVWHEIVVRFVPIPLVFIQWYSNFGQTLCRAKTKQLKHKHSFFSIWALSISLRWLKVCHLELKQDRNQHNKTLFARFYGKIRFFFCNTTCFCQECTVRRG